MTQDMISLGFDQIVSQLQEQAVSKAARTALEGTAPYMSEGLCRARMEETTAARRVMENAGTPPLTETEETETGLTGALQGGMLLPAQLACAARFCGSVRRLRRYLIGAQAFSAGIASWHAELPDLDSLEEEIDRSIREDTVLDEASPALRNLRRQREHTEQGIRDRLNQLILRHKKELADSYITQRGGAWVLPVQKRFQSQFPGRVVDASGKGATVFMEPSAVQTLRQTLDQLLIDIDMEERRVLWALSDRVAAEAEPLRRAIRVMTDLDALFARAKLSLAMDARPAEITAERRFCLRGARHPLLNREACVPLDLEMALPDAGIAVTGPNTGGKTVCLKTVGLLTLMAQSGLHIPCTEGTVIGMMDRVLCDIGDSQSISQNLSTFSGHMTNVIRILGECSRDSLVLLDELGSGTDPAEGTGLAAAILEELARRGCFFMVTTHDPQIKQWAEQTPRVIPGRMAFDRATLKPLYRLELGRSGESCAIEIARRLGMDGGLLERARQVADGGVGTAAKEPRRPMRVPATRLQRLQQKTEGHFERFAMGDSVLLLPDRKNAIVYQPADDEGNVVIQLQGQKLTVRHNRLKLLVPASELYPPDYDFSIIFDTVANRKAAHTMARKFDPNAVIVHSEGRPAEQNERIENNNDSDVKRPLS
ncbi:MAG: DNA mismatch repair protein MutS [Clostridia bacterium]|nr:DNA mismatch repair protein MutS [Clostridia bacterium]MBR6028414.1 DNA mismatch repair protein MutS [Clostridia bacterium]